MQHIGHKGGKEMSRTASLMNLRGGKKGNGWDQLALTGGDGRGG